MHHVHTRDYPWYGYCKICFKFATLGRMKAKRPFLSVVIPCYNEEKRIVAGLTTLVLFLKKQNYSWKIVAVDDGSTDKTQLLLKKQLKGLPHQLLKHPQNRGKGRALRTGVLAATGKYIVFSDIDLSTPPDQLPQLLAALKTHDLAIGVRRHPKSRVIKHQPKLREFLGHIFTKLTNYLVVPQVIDVTCGFKGFRSHVGQHLFTQSKVDRWAFDAEILFLARKYAYSIAQIPVVWADNPATRVHLLQDGICALFDILYIRVGDMLGRYT